MEALRVRSMRARYRMTAAQLPSKARLDRILRRMLDDVLQESLAGRGIGPHEWVCIQRLETFVQLRLDQDDESVAALWGESIARAVALVSQSPPGAVIRFHSTEHALVDLAISSARGSFSRVWAWRAVGLWRSALANADVGARELAAALTQRPTAIVAVLRAVASARAWEELEALLSPEQTQQVEAALVSAAAEPALRTPRAVGSAVGPNSVRARSGEGIDLEALLSKSSIARTAAQAFSARRRTDARRVSMQRLALVAAVLEVDPGALRRYRAVVTEWLQRPFGALAATFGRRLFDDAETPAGEPRASLVRGSSQGAAARQHRAAGAESSEGERPGASAARGQPLLDAERAPDGTPADDCHQPLDLRERARTRAGGLLFLHHIVRALNLADEVAREPAWDARSTRSVMYQLALILLPNDANDAAACAFAGMGPLSGAALLDDPAPTPDERQLLASYADRIVEHLRAMLGDQRSSRERLLFAVCRRDAQIVADPAWIDVQLALEDVSVDVRRAGLDLDLGWLPWLGAVVRFTYG